MNEKNIYSKLRELRRSRGLTVNKLADKMGEDHQKVGRIERGKRSLTIDYLMKVSKALETPVETILKEQHQRAFHERAAETSYSLLNEIVVAVEKKLASGLDPQKKGKCIAKIYESAQGVPGDYHEQFLDAVVGALEECLL